MSQLTWVELKEEVKRTEGALHCETGFLHSRNLDRRTFDLSETGERPLGLSFRCIDRGVVGGFEEMFRDARLQARDISIVQGGVNLYSSMQKDRERVQEE